MKDATTNDPVKGYNVTSRTFPRSTSSRLAAMARAFSSKTQAPDPVPPRAFMAGGVSPESSDLRSGGHVSDMTCFTGPNTYIYIDKYLYIYILS